MTEKRYGFEMDKNCYKCICDTIDKKLYTDKKQVVDLLNEQQERILTLEKFLIMKNREINNSIILSDEFKELWNGSLKKFVGELE